MVSQREAKCKIRWQLGLLGFLWVTGSLNNCGQTNLEIPVLVGIAGGCSLGPRIPG